MTTETATPTTSLASLARGERALVIEIGPGDPKLGAKLAARGVVPGVEVGILRAGDPILLAVDEARWALTRLDAGRVHVDPIEQPRIPLLKRLFGR